MMGRKLHYLKAPRIRHFKFSQTALPVNQTRISATLKLTEGNEDKHNDSEHGVDQSKYQSGFDAPHKALGYLIALHSFFYVSLVLHEAKDHVSVPEISHNRITIKKT